MIEIKYFFVLNRLFKNLNNIESLFCGSVLLDVEVLNLIRVLAWGNNVQKLSETVLFQILFSQILQVSLWEVNFSSDCDFLIVVVDFDCLSSFSSSASDLDSASQELSEVGSVEDLIFDGFWAIDGEVEVDFGVIWVLCSGGFSSGGSVVGCNCGHDKLYKY